VHELFGQATVKAGATIAVNVTQAAAALLVGVCEVTRREEGGGLAIPVGVGDGPAVWINDGACPDAVDAALDSDAVAPCYEDAVVGSIGLHTDYLALALAGGSSVAGILDEGVSSSRCLRKLFLAA
jgi:hypothetical protein